MLLLFTLAVKTTLLIPELVTFTPFRVITQAACASCGCLLYTSHPKTTQLFEGIYPFVKGKFLNHKSVHPYRTREVEVLDAQHALIGIDGRLMNTPVGSFPVSYPHLLEC